MRSSWVAALRGWPLMVVGVLCGCADPKYAAESDGSASTCPSARCDDALARDAAQPVPGQAAAQPVPGQDAAQLASGQDSPQANAGPARTSPDESPRADLDAGPASAIGADASPPSVELPSEALALRGTYAVRTRTYSHDLPNRLGSFMHEFVVLAEIRLDQAKASLLLDTRLCQDRTDISVAGGPITTAILYPGLWPVRTYALHYAQGRFYTTSDAPLRVGFDPAPPAACTPGGTLPRRLEQVWNSDGTCVCPGSDALPTSASDCRVNDSDKDGRPGWTTQLTGPTGVTLESAVMQDASQYVNGTVASDGKHTAQYVSADTYFALACDSGSSGCSNGASSVCPPAQQPVWFVPLAARAVGDAWTCDQVKAALKAGELFPNDKPIFPSGC